MENEKIENVVSEEVKEETKESSTEEKKVEETKAEETKAEDPKTEELKAEEPKAEEAKAEETKAEEAKAEEPKAEETKPVETKAEEKKPAEKKAPKEGKKKKTGVIIGIAAAVVAAIVLLVVIVVVVVAVLVLHKPTVNLNEYVTIESSGYDGYGKATYTIDGNKLMDDYGDKIKFTNKFKKQLKDATSQDLWALSLVGINPENDNDAIVLFSTVFLSQGKLSETSNLSNGDVITYSWDYSGVTEDEIDEFAGLLGVKVKYSDIEYTVEGLQQVQSFDPFSGVNITYQGIAPNGSAFIEVADGTDLDYRLDKTSELSNGDQITVTVTPRYGIDDYVNKYGKVPSTDSATFVVEGLGEYVSSAAQIPAEELEKMKTQGNETIQSMISTLGWKEGYEIDINYIGNYFLDSKGNDNFVKANKVYMVYKIHYSKEVKDYKGKQQVVETDFYYWVSWSEMYVNSDGIFVYDLNKYEKSKDYSKHQWDVYQDKIFGTPYNQAEIYFYGYDNLDLLYNKVVTANVEQYNVEENVVDTAPATTEETTEETATE